MMLPAINEYVNRDWKNVLLPSSGGMGNKFHAAKRMLKKKSCWIKLLIGSGKTKRRSSVLKNAPNNKLERGPVSDINPKERRLGP